MEITIEDFYDPANFQVAYLNQIPHQKQIEVLRSKQKNKIIVCGKKKWQNKNGFW